jgi:hypothetical protein
MVDQRRVALLNLGDVFVGVFSDLTEALVAFVDEDMDAAGAGIAESGAAVRRLPSGIPARLTYGPERGGVRHRAPHRGQLMLIARGVPTAGERGRR